MWRLDKNKPICPQIYSILSVKIASGELKAGEKLLSVREVSLNAGVNPNTVQKAFEMLHNDGLIYSVRSSGWFVGEDVSLAKQTVQRLIKEKTKTYLNDMQSLGVDPKEVATHIQEEIQ